MGLLKRLFAGAGAAIFLIAGSIAGTAAAHAAVVPSAITSVSIEQTMAIKYDFLTIHLGWAVPDGAEEGDTFSVTLPEELRAVGSDFTLTDGSGAVVATATMSGSTVTFTLTDYVATHANTHGDATIRAQFFSDAADNTSVPLRFVTGDGDAFDLSIFKYAVTPIDRSQPAKAASWMDLQDQGITKPQNAIWWQVAAPRGPSTTTRFTDTLGPGMKMDCAMGFMSTFEVQPSTGYLINQVDIDPSRVTVHSCTDTGFDVSISGAQPGEILSVGYFTSLTDQWLADYSNTATVTQDSGSQIASSSIQRYSSGGSGAGNNLGQLTVTKAYAGDGIALAKGPFKVLVDCQNGGSAVNGFPRTLSFENAGSQSLVLPFGTVCTADETDIGNATASDITPPPV
ncbi:hypothetical protein G7067_04485 [Leucobacter insecticola]|uniref:Uncharacterized protein n=1 Tax=Leucobacter insecticola TaxID=2714934 RepID=A0A6G8FH99_9MICO|nr:Ig-like domain-containing protein [Leucobacter insecticola]QIM15840.1 hypothetical protein G7067_04485 [Leucobacter insecticola]